MKRMAAFVAAAFAVGLAVVIGNRMSADAMAVVVGVGCGVLASVPTSLLLVWALGRRGQGNGVPIHHPARNGLASSYPPVVVVNPGTGYASSGYAPPPPPSLPSGNPRTFKVVGDEETLLDELQHIFPGLAEGERHEHSAIGAGDD